MKPPLFCLTVAVASLVVAIGPSRAEEDVDARLQKLEGRLEEMERDREGLRKEIQELRESRQKEQQAVADLKKSVAAARPGSQERETKSNFLIKGYAFANYKSREGSNSTFESGFNPIFLWRYGDNVLFEAEPEFELEDGKTETNLEYSVISYVWNDYLTLRAGKFLLPLGTFSEKLHPAWINKLPTKPLPYASNALIPAEDVGFDFRGAVPIGKTPAVFAYDAWVANGPDQSAGAIRFGRNYGDNNDNKAFGGRLALLPIPPVEFGVSGMHGQWNDASDPDNLDFSAVVADGTWNIGSYHKLMGEWLWTRREPGSGSSPVDQAGFWIQGSSRLGMLDNPYLRKLELVARYGEVASDAELSDRLQYTFGLNYYLTSTLQCKAAYDINRGEAAADKKDQFTLQVAYGF